MNNYNTFMKYLLSTLIAFSFFLYCSLTWSENNHYKDSQYFNSKIEIKFNGVYDVPPYGNIEAFDCNTVPVEIFQLLKIELKFNLQIEKI